jgi:membrane protein required for colicin V production
MHTLDIVLLLILAVGLIRGYSTGLIRQVAGVLGMLVGFLLASQMNETVGEGLGMTFGIPEELRPIVGFAVVFFGVLIAASILVKAVEVPINALKLTPINRILGGAVGVGKAMLVASVALGVLGFASWPSESVREESALYGSVRGALPVVWDFVADNIPAVTDFAQTVTEDAADSIESVRSSDDGEPGTR